MFHTNINVIRIRESLFKSVGYAKLNLVVSCNAYHQWSSKLEQSSSFVNIGRSLWVQQQIFWILLFQSIISERFILIISSIKKILLNFKLYGITRLIGGVGTMAAVPIYNYVYSIGKKFEYANYGFAAAIG